MYGFCSFFISDIAWEFSLQVITTVAHVSYNNKYQLYIKNRNSSFLIKFIWMRIGKIAFIQVGFGSMQPSEGPALFSHRLL